MITSQGLPEDLFALLGDNETTRQMFANLEAAVESLREDDSKSHESDGLENISKFYDGVGQALLPILQQLNAEYYVARDNTQKFHKVAPLVGLLEGFVQASTDLTGMLENNMPLAEEILQLHFKVSNYYSLASTLDPKNYDLCSKWLEKAGDFIVANGLVDTRNHAVWHNLVGGHASRGFEMGLFDVFPHSCVAHFEEAVRIHDEKLGSKVDNREDVHFRHVMMCLASVTTDEALNKILLQGAITPDIEKTCFRIKGTMAFELTDEVLVLPNGSPDHYRRADCWQIRSRIALLEGDFLAAREAIDNAEREMEASIATTGATGQLSKLLSDSANIHIALATAKALKAQQLSEGQFEDMYAKVAQKQLADMELSKFSQLAKMIVAHMAKVNEAVDLNEEVKEFSAKPGFMPAFVSAQEIESKSRADVADVFVNADQVLDAEKSPRNSDLKLH